MRLEISLAQQNRERSLKATRNNKHTHLINFHPLKSLPSIFDKKKNVHYTKLLCSECIIEQKNTCYFAIYYTPDKIINSQ